MIRKLRILALFFLSLQLISAQHQISLETRIRAKVLNSHTGFLLIKTADEMLAINPESREVAWKKRALQKVDLQSYQEIPFTPLVIFEGKPLVNSKLLSNTLNTKGVSRTIMNVTNGKVLFDSEAGGFKAVYNTMLIPERNAVLVDGLKDKKMVVCLYDYNTGNLLWENDMADSDFFKTVKGTLLNREQILLDTYQNIYWLKNKFLMKISIETGESEFDQDNVQSIALNEAKDVVFVFTDKIALEKLNQETAIIAYNTSSMTPLWEAPVKVVGNIRDTAIDEGQMVVITSKGFNIVDKAGNKEWDKSASLPLIKKIVPIEDGYLVVQEKYLNRIDKEGQKAWEKPVEISLSPQEQPVHIFNEGMNAMYITPSRANVISIANGVALGEEIALNTSGFISRNLKLKEHLFAVWYDEKHKQFPVYNENDFYVLNIHATSKPEPTFTFDFNKQVPDLETRDQGYFVHHDNKFYLFDLKGALVYKREYPSNMTSSLLDKTIGVVRRGLGTYTAAVGFVGRQFNQTFKSVLVSQNVGFLSNAASGIYGTYQSYQGSIENVSKVKGMDFSSTLTDVFSRFKKGQENDDSVIVLVPSEKEETGSIIRLTIADGSEEELRKITEDQEDFIVDQIEGIIYFFDKDTVVIERL